MKTIKTFNDIDRTFLEEFLITLPKEDKEKLKEYLANNPKPERASAVFTLVKSYVWNTYFKTTPETNKRHTNTFADELDDLLACSDEEE